MTDNNKKNYKGYIMELIAQFAGQKNVITIPRPFIHICGDINTAIFLSQLLFWTDRGKRSDGFIYKTYKEWESEIGLSEYQVKRAVDKLKKEGVLDTKLKKANGAPTLHYFIVRENFENWILDKLQNGILKNSVIDSEETSNSINIDYNKN